MIDLHTHSLASDGALLPSELVRRAVVAGYRAIAITDHADGSNIASVVKQLIKAASELDDANGIRVVPGVELTHIPVADIPRLVKKARGLGARMVVGHGETLAEPVAPGTNLAYIRAKVDILAHPGLVGGEECRSAAKNGVSFELTSRSGHSLSNGHVAAAATRFKVRLVLNTDTHGPNDLISLERALKIALGAGLDNTGFEKIRRNAAELLEKASV